MNIQLMKPKNLTEEKDNLTVKEKIALLKALNGDNNWTDDAEIEELSLSEYYLD